MIREFLPAFIACTLIGLPLVLVGVRLLRAQRSGRSGALAVSLIGCGGFILLVPALGIASVFLAAVGMIALCDSSSSC